jgi:hypothetical protein
MPTERARLASSLRARLELGASLASAALSAAVVASTLRLHSRARFSEPSASSSVWAARAPPPVVPAATAARALAMAARAAARGMDLMASDRDWVWREVGRKSTGSVCACRVPFSHLSQYTTASYLGR